MELEFQKANLNLLNHIKKHFDNNKPFLIGRLACLEPIVVYSVMMNSMNNNLMYKLSNNAGIFCVSKESLVKWSKEYYNSMKNSTNLGIWEKEGGVYKWTGPSQEFFIKAIKPSQVFYAPALSAFDYVPSWTTALHGKKILIISPFTDSIESQVKSGNLARIFKHQENWFQDCSFIYVKTPQTQAGNHGGIDWEVRFHKLCRNVDSAITEDFDCALLSCGGYGMPLANYIFKKGKSAIYVGGVLQILFGVMGGRWEVERNIDEKINREFWTRPTDAEKPPNFKLVEGGCYW